MNQRDALLSSMRTCRNSMINEIDKLQEVHLKFSDVDDGRERLMNLAQLAGEDNVELLTLRDQILALMEKMDKQNVQNNFLLGNRIDSLEKDNYTHQYKSVKRRVQPKKNSVQKKPLIKTLEVPFEENI